MKDGADHPLFLFAQTENLNFAKQNNFAFGFGKLRKSEESATENLDFQKQKNIADRPTENLNIEKLF